MAQRNPPIFDYPVRLRPREINTTVRYGRYCGTKAEHETERRKLVAYATQCKVADMFVPKEVVELQRIMKEHGLRLVVRAHYDETTRESAHYLQLSLDTKEREKRLLERLGKQLDEEGKGKEDS